jgi:hypothetical protein
VVDVSAEVESEILLKTIDVGKIACLSCLVEPSESVVRSIDVGFVMLGVMKFHNSSADMRLEGSVVIGQIWQYVGRHSVLLWFGVALV